jgi:hypothetical protein
MEQQNRCLPDMQQLSFAAAQRSSSANSLNRFQVVRATCGPICPHQEHEPFLRMLGLERFEA